VASKDAPGKMGTVDPVHQLIVNRMVVVWGRDAARVLRYKVNKVVIRGSLQGSLLSFNDFKLKIYQFLSNFKRAGTANRQFLRPRQAWKTSSLRPPTTLRERPRMLR
jgi:hypothetical protein